MAGWPFWAATSDERIEQALDLAGLEEGDHFVDLGCGDGRVLLRAAARGATVTGVELDPELARAASRLLADNGVDGEVLEADLATVPLGDLDVVFAYLSPATLQRLRPELTTMRPASRLVTTGYAVPGWEPDEVGDRCFLYRFPVTVRAVDRARRGWATSGVLVSIRPDAPALVAVTLHHPGGRVDVRSTRAVEHAPFAVRAGADVTEPGDEVVVDLRFEPQPVGTLVVAALDPGAHVATPLQLFVTVAEGETGVWGLSSAGCDAVGTAFARGDVASVLTQARRASR